MGFKSFSFVLYIIKDHQIAVCIFINLILLQVVVKPGYLEHI